MSELDQFRQETRAWLEENCPAAMRTPVTSDADQFWGGRNPNTTHPDQVVWMERMAERGWTAPTWPAEYGGGGLTKEQAGVLRQEMGASGPGVRWKASVSICLGLL